MKDAFWRHFYFGFSSHPNLSSTISCYYIIKLANDIFPTVIENFQAWSNDMYKSVEHKVVANRKLDRYSIAYFLCPSYESLIGSYREPSIYRKFTFGEYRSQIQQDVKRNGHKVGLPRFLL